MCAGKATKDVATGDSVMQSEDALQAAKVIRDEKRAHAEAVFMAEAEAKLLKKQVPAISPLAVAAKARAAAVKKAVEKAALDKARISKAGEDVALHVIGRAAAASSSDDGLVHFASEDICEQATLELTGTA